MKIFTSEQIKEIDRYTIENEPVTSVDLMERAGGKLFEWISKRFDRSRRFLIFTGPGNNGGDGLVLARLFFSAGYNVEVFYIHFTEKVTPDWKINHARLENERFGSVIRVNKKEDLPQIYDTDIIIDAIFGSGLARRPEGLVSEVIEYINRCGCEIIAIDIPSGLFGENNSGNGKEVIIRANHTLTFQFPKLSMMFAENYPYTGEWHVIPIGLHPLALKEFTTPYNYIEATEIIPVLKRRKKFDHKGIYGHGLLISGSRTKTGAALLAAKASLRSGIGLITCHIPSGSSKIIQSSLPEAMVQPDKNKKVISGIDNVQEFSAIGVGPGIGIEEETRSAIHELLKTNRKPIVIDADAINILSENKEWLSLIQPGTIFTPHLKEFERLAGRFDNSYSRLMGQISFSLKYKCVVVLKGAHTSVSMPDGTVFFNSTGNPGMATGGSGDILTGIILSLLAQGYSAVNAAVAGVFIHGLAGDIALEKRGYESLIASDIIEYIGAAYNKMWEQTIA